MFKNYITIAIYSLLKNKLYSAINIVGLAIGLAACIIITLYVKDQYSYDKQWKNSDNIYRVIFYSDVPGQGPSTDGTVSLRVMPALEEYFKDQIVQSARIYPYSFMFSTGESKFLGTLVRVDPAFIDMFQLEVLSGSLENTLSQKGQIALSSVNAIRYFGNQDPVGKAITLSIGDQSIDYMVTAVYKIPGDTTLNIPSLSLLDTASFHPVARHWLTWESKAYFQLENDVDIETLKPLLPAFIDRNIDISEVMPNPDLSASDVISMDFKNIETAHFDSPWDPDSASGNKITVMSITAISFLVLLIGCINFTILTTAKATQRAREIAMRKVVGAKRKQLVLQFLGESAFIVLIAMLLSMGIVEIMLPVFESIVGKTLSLDYATPSVFIPLFLMFLIVSLSGGLYPAFILSGFRPGNILKMNQSNETGSMTFRNVLVIFQFSVSIMLVISTLVIYTQLKYCLNRDPGYNKDNLLVLNHLDYLCSSQDKMAVLKQELLSFSDISDVTTSQLQPSQFWQAMASFTLRGRPDNSYNIGWTSIGHDYFKTYQVPMIAGRDFSIERDATDLLNKKSGEIGRRNIIINEDTARHLGFASAEEAVGNILHETYWDIENTIIGVVADNHIFSIYSQPDPNPVIYLLYSPPEVSSVMTIRYRGNRKKIVERVKSVWEKVIGRSELPFVFADQLMQAEFQQEQTEAKVLVSFSLLAILIACMGLFGSASFTVDRRTKEIGLRKVMGARVKNIVNLFLWQFSKPVLIANIVAWPVAIYAMRIWLERFPYRFHPIYLFPICLVSGLIAFAIAWVTVAGNTTRAARKSPIHSLRYE